MFRSKVRWLCGMILFLASCIGGSGARERALHESLGDSLRQVEAAQATAAAHWDELIVGTPLNCQKGLPVPASQLPTAEAPLAVQIRGHLQLSIQELQESAALWDAICAQETMVVALEHANLGYLAARDAGIEVELARSVYNDWNP